MSFVELLPIVRSLSPQDKLRLIQHLAADLAGAEDSESLSIPPGHAYPLWSPDRAYEAAEILLQALNNEVGRP